MPRLTFAREALNTRKRRVESTSSRNGRLRVAINGIGVAGPTLAYWLRHYGMEPVLFEKAPALRTGG